jgi:prevent-host-death family protein
MMNKMSVVDMMNAMVPITRFNKGEAAKIFDEVETTGTKIVVKNNRPACVLISPSQYESLMDLLSDYALMVEAQKRVACNDDSENLSHEEMLKELGVTGDDLVDIDVDIE